jgi:hypothetical protein
MPGRSIERATLLQEVELLRSEFASIRQQIDLVADGAQRTRHRTLRTLAQQRSGLRAVWKPVNEVIDEARRVRQQSLLQRLVTSSSRKDYPAWILFEL